MQGWTRHGGLALGAAGLLVALGTVQIARRERAQIEQLHRYQPPAPDRPEARVVGRARPSDPARVGIAQLPRAPSGRACLVWEQVVTVERTSARKTERVPACRGDSPMLDFAIETADHTRVRPQFFDLKMGALPHPLNGLALPPGCPLSPADRAPVTTETCLQDGDEVEAWGCQRGDRLVACPTGPNEVLAVTPEQTVHNPLERQRTAGWRLLASLGLGATALLGGSVRRLGRQVTRLGGQAS